MSLPYCIHCERHVYHTKKQPCRKFTQAKQAIHESDMKAAQEANELQAKKQHELNDEMVRFSKEFPLLCDYFQKRFDALEREIFKK
jgi:hypothetical protein